MAVLSGDAVNAASCHSQGFMTSSVNATNGGTLSATLLAQYAPSSKAVGEWTKDQSVDKSAASLLTNTWRPFYLCFARHSC